MTIYEALAKGTQVVLVLSYRDSGGGRGEWWLLRLADRGSAVRGCGAAATRAVDDG